MTSTARNLVICADFPIGKMWEHGLREIDMLEVDTECPPWMPMGCKTGTERRQMEGPESYCRKAFLSLREQDIITYVSVFTEQGDETTPEWLI